MTTEPKALKWNWKEHLTAEELETVTDLENQIAQAKHLLAGFFETHSKIRVRAISRARFAAGLRNRKKRTNGKK